MKKNKLSLTLHSQMSNDVDYPSLNGYNFQTMTNLNIIYIPQIKADDR
jgi:hypothetical protein